MIPANGIRRFPIEEEPPDVASNLVTTVALRQRS
jgi:hypothetical protein